MSTAILRAWWRFFLATVMIICVEVSTLGAIASDPRDEIQGAIERALKIAQEADTKKMGDEELVAAIRPVLYRYMDFARMSRRALGEFWKTRKQSEREEFVEAFRRFLERTHAKNVKAYKSIKFSKGRLSGKDGRLESVITVEKREFNVVYFVHKKGEEWKIYDIEIEKLKMMGTSYRAQIKRLIDKYSFPKMLQKLRGFDGVKPVGVGH